MKKAFIGSFTAALMLLFTAPAFADSVLQIWSCQLEDGKTPADLMAASSVWLKAAKSSDGGANVKATLEYPIVADAGDGKFSFVLIVDDTTTWGVFNNDYANSAAGQAEEAWGEVATCSKSSLWASVDIE